MPALLYNHRMTSPDWSLASDEVIRHLQALLRLQTVNPPGHETLAADYIARALQAEGIDPVVLEPKPGRGSVIARLKGLGQDPPLVIYGHTDVVPVEPQHWTHPPFSGRVSDGFVWGRGALDMKGAVAQQLTAFLLLKRNNVPLKRDVIFAATADEEIGGEDGCGMAWLVNNHPDLLRAGFGITEVGGYSTEIGGKTVYPIQVAEKGAVWLTVRFRGRPGHASMPHDDNALVHLSRAVDRLATAGLPYHLGRAADGFLTAVAQGVGGPFGEALSQLRSEAGARRALNTVFKSHELRPFLAAMLYNTAAPTRLEAGYKTNVIPGEAALTLDGRTLPGFDTQAFLGELQAVVGDAAVFEVEMAWPALETGHDTPLFGLMAGKLREHDPAGIVVPYMMSGATDAKYMARLGVQTYGFSPLKLPPGFKFMELFHAHDERVPVQGLGWGLRVLYEVLCEFCS
jgi:acetylornithine deacetylase/succinyl-diaminopimelate desuccinylase-like protein